MFYTNGNSSLCEEPRLNTDYKLLDTQSNVFIFTLPGKQVSYIN